MDDMNANLPQDETDAAPALSEPLDGTRGDYALYRHLHTDPAPLEECLGSFWAAGIPQADMPEIHPPGAEPYEILKRLGPSPFAGGGFPLIGFFASAYDRVSRFARQRAGDGTRSGPG